MQNKSLKELSSSILENFTDKTDSQKMKAMEKWFLENYDCPAVKQFELGDESYLDHDWNSGWDIYEDLLIFEDSVKDEIIRELAQKLSSSCPNWRSIMDYSSDYLQSILSEVDYYGNFTRNIDKVESLLKHKIVNEEKDYILGLLFINVITSIETYLSDAFINTIYNDEEDMRNFVVNCEDFKKEKFNFSEIYDKYENIDIKVRDYLSSLMWHSLDKIKPIYKSTLNVDFPNKNILSPIFRAIKIRHDLVHRSGKNKKGDKITIEPEQVEHLYNVASEFVEHINNQLNKRKEDDIFNIKL